METSRAATWAARIGGAALLALALGPLLIQVGALSGLVGFRLFGVGLLLGLVALVVGGVGLWTTRAASGRGGRSQALAGAGMGVAALAVVLVSAGSGLGVPPINDITTSPDDPPVFRDASLTYGGEDFARQQRAAYPDLEPIRLDAPPPRAFEEAARAAEGLGWEVVHRDAAGGVIEATETTRIFRFVDDVVIRIRPAGAGSVLDVRSKSREGRGDLGANAARIRAFRDALGGG